MSHSVKVTLIADQEIDLLGWEINVHDIESIVLDSHGKVVEFCAMNSHYGCFSYKKNQSVKLISKLIKENDGDYSDLYVDGIREGGRE